MANLPGSIKNLNTLLGEQLTEGGGGGGGAEPLIVDFFEDDDLGETILSGATVDEIAQALKKGSLIARENYASGSITIVNWYPVRYYKLQPNGDITDILFVDIATPEGISYSLSRDGSHYYKED